MRGTDSQLWAERYDGDVADVFAIESEVAGKIIAQLKSKLSPEEKATIEERPTADLAAYDTRAAALVPTSLLAYPLVRHGERFPFVAPNAEGFIVAESDLLQLHPDLVYTAYLEGVALLERLAYEVVTELGIQ